MTDVKSPETYIGTDRAENFASPGGASQDQVHAYTSPSTLARNQWALTGDWRVGEQDAILAQPGGGITYRFHARDLHLVLGPVPDGKPVKSNRIVHLPSVGAREAILPIPLKSPPYFDLVDRFIQRCRKGKG